MQIKITETIAHITQTGTIMQISVIPTTKSTVIVEIMKKSEGGGNVARLWLDQGKKVIYLYAGTAVEVKKRKLV